MKLAGLSKLALSVVGQCTYKLETRAAYTGTGVEPIAPLINAAGVMAEPARAPEVDIQGVLSGITKESLRWLDEGQHAESMATFTSSTQLRLRGTCQNPLAGDYFITEPDGQRWIVRKARRRGCVYTYLLEQHCEPDC